MLKKNIDQLTDFRKMIHGLIPFYRDATLDLIDALSTNKNAQSVTQLSDNQFFRRKYNSLTKVIHYFLVSNDDEEVQDNQDKSSPSTVDYQVNKQIQKAIQTQIAHLCPVPKKKKFFLFASDVTPAVRAYAKTLEDKSIVYAPNPAPGNKPIAVGHAYSVLACMPEKAATSHAPWIIPLSVDRVSSSEKGHEVGPKKLCELIKDSSLPFNRSLCVHVADTAYFTLPIREMTSRVDNVVSIVRLRNNRTVYAPPTETGRIKYAEKMKLNHPATHIQPDQVVEIETSTSKKRPITVVIKVWNSRLLRGTNEFKGYENPFNLHQICVFDKVTNKKLFKRPMWLAVDGERRHEIEAKSVYESYRQRYDIEHFFRFGKQKLLMASFQTPDVNHEEKWWQIVQLAYTQLYLSREICQLIPNPWERYLPRFKQAVDEDIAATVSPSLAQRYFSKILEQIGTPAKDVRKVKPGTGREEGDKQEKRTLSPIIFKTPKVKNKEQKKDPGKIQVFEKQQNSSKPQKINDLIVTLKNWLSEIEISKNELLLMLEKELPA
jgi:ribosomal 50S subunit-recycling heat shock protein